MQPFHMAPSYRHGHTIETNSVRSSDPSLSRRRRFRLISHPPSKASPFPFPSLSMAAPPLPPWLTLTLSPSSTPKEPPLSPLHLADCFRELEQSHQTFLSHKKETSWRLRRVQLQLESEKASKRRQKVEEIEAKVKALQEEQAAAMDRIDAECKEQVLALRREAEAKEQKLVDHLASKQAKIGSLIQQLGCFRR